MGKYKYLYCPDIAVRAHLHTLYLVQIAPSKILGGGGLFDNDVGLIGFNYETISEAEAKFLTLR